MKDKIREYAEWLYFIKSASSKLVESQMNVLSVTHLHGINCGYEVVYAKYLDFFGIDPKEIEK